MSQKIGFWAVFALVTGSQIGSGVFLLPASLAPFGKIALIGWILSGLGAISLALVFSKLCALYPKTGGPHVYVKEAFGPSLSFFTGWTYWVISWVSTTAVVVASIGYLSPIIGTHSALSILAMEIILLLSMTTLNLKGIEAAGKAEFFLTAIKLIPLFLIPLIAIFKFDISNFYIAPEISQIPLSQQLSYVTLMTLWGFIGVESATTAADSVENPSVTIPKAIILGTICVAAVYFFNSLGILGVVPGAELQHSAAPYVDAAKVLFGGNWYLLVSAIASIICIGTLNAWILASGQIALGLAQDGLLPSFFGKKNQNEAPSIALISSSIGIIPLLAFTVNTNIAQQINSIIDFSVIAFLFVYLICCLSLLKILIRENLKNYFSMSYTLIAISFCLWVILKTSFMTSLKASFFSLTGIPFYFYWIACKNKSNKFT